MTSVRVIHHIDDLAADLIGIAKRAPRELKAAVREGIRVGNTVAKDNALRSSGTHGGPPKGHYVRAFSAEMHGGAGLFGNTYSGEYGPDAGRPQGRMSFEFGSRNQKPHLDLAKSADLVGPALAGEVRDKIGDWFW